jgi:hypothetical protein
MIIFLFLSLTQLIHMYHIFEESPNESSVIFAETCETRDELEELLQNPTLPVQFVYDDITRSFSHLNGYYDLDQCSMIVKSRLNT